jgi:plasmid stability protein
MKQLKVGVDALTDAKLGVRAGQAGISVSEYVRQVIARDLAGEGEPLPAVARQASLPNVRSMSDELLPRIHELVTLNTVLTRAVLTAGFGEQTAQRIQDLAEDKTAKILRRLPAGD